MTVLRSSAFFLVCTFPVLACADGGQVSSPPALDACYTFEDPQRYWLAVRENAATADANELAPLLADCLRSSDPVLRDHIAYEVLTYWLRKEELSSPVKRGLVFRLQAWLSVSDASGGFDPAITRAFSALVLSELVRADSVAPFLSEDEVLALVNDAATMFSSERDYRGLVPEIGWIHTIAHGSDLLWRLSAHPSVKREQLQVILDAMADQLTTAEPPAFTFNEPDRMARVISTVAARPEVPEAIVASWLSLISEPAELSSWNDAFNSIAGMVKLHNTKTFLRALRESLANGDQLALVSQVDELLAEIP